jgi:curved DNA-binding protein
MEYRDYYKVLGVDRNASDKDIKRAYRRLAREFHPDVNPGDQQAEERFKEINEAHEVLGDPEKRVKYDQLGANYQRWQRMGRDPGSFDWSQWAGGAPGGVRFEWQGDLGDLFGGAGGAFSDFFQTIFGGMAGGGGARGRQGRVQPGRDLEANVEIDLEEAFNGTTRLLESDGSRIRVKIPPGARTGSRIRVKGKGTASYGGGPAGDLYLNVSVKPHRKFERDGDDLRCGVEVDLYTAVLGGETRIRMLNGEVALKIPAGTSGGKVFRLRGKGMPKPSSPKQHGDLLATVRVKVPDKLSNRERELFEELAGEGGKAKGGK